MGFLDRIKHARLKGNVIDDVNHRVEEGIYGAKKKIKDLNYEEVRARTQAGAENASRKIQYGAAKAYYGAETFPDKVRGRVQEIEDKREERRENKKETKIYKRVQAYKARLGVEDLPDEDLHNPNYGEGAFVVESQKVRAYEMKIRNREEAKHEYELTRQEKINEVSKALKEGKINEVQARQLVSDIRRTPSKPDDAIRQDIQKQKELDLALKEKAARKAQGAGRVQVMGTYHDAGFGNIARGTDALLSPTDKSDPLNQYFGFAGTQPAQDTETVSNIHPLKALSDNLLTKPSQSNFGAPSRHPLEDPNFGRDLIGSTGSSSKKSKGSSNLFGNINHNPDFSDLLTSGKKRKGKKGSLF